MGTSPDSAPRIVVIGDVALDYTIEVLPGDADDEKVAVVNSSRGLGGTAANSAAQIARLGGRVEVISAIGDDFIGDWLRAELVRADIDSGPSSIVSGRSTVATIVASGTSRTVYVDIGVGAVIRLRDDDQIAAADLIYVSYAPQLVQELVDRGFGPRLVVGLEHWMASSAVLEAARHARLVVTNAAGLAKFGSDRFTALVVTLGAAGIEVWSNGSRIQSVPAFAVDAVDATGAGDAFAGALCYQLASGVKLTSAIRFGAAVAALSTLAVGAQSAQPTDRQVEDFLAEHFPGGVAS